MRCLIFIYGIFGFYFELIREKVENVLEFVALYFIDFCIRTSCTGHGCKMLILDIKDFCPKTTCGSEIISYILPVVALRALVFRISHIKFILIIIKLIFNHQFDKGFLINGEIVFLNIYSTIFNFV